MKSQLHAICTFPRNPLVRFTRLSGLDWSPTFAEAYGEVFTSVQTLAFAAFSMLKLGRGRASAWRTFLPASFESSPLQISTEDGEHQIPRFFGLVVLQVGAGESRVPSARKLSANRAKPFVSSSRDAGTWISSTIIGVESDSSPDPAPMDVGANKSR